MKKLLLGLFIGLGLTAGIAYAATNLPSTVNVGDLLRGGTNGNLVRIATSTEGQVLKIVGGLPAWGNDLQAAGGGATTTITSNVQSSGPDFTFATSSATGLNLNITGSGSTVTFTPQLQTGYSIPLTASTTNFQTAFLWGNHATAGYLTSASLTPYLTTTTAASTYEPVQTKGNLTATAPLEFNSTRQVIGGAAALSVASGYNIPLTASTTNWNTAYGWGNHSGLYPTFAYASSTFPSFTYASSTYYLASNPSSYITLSSLSGTSPIAYNSGTGAFSVAANYGIPLTASTTEWTNLYNNVLSRVTTNNGTSGSVIALATSTNAITLNVPSTVSYLGSTVDPNELSNADFGAFTCSAGTCTLDTTYLTAAITSLNGLTGASQTFATTVTGSIFNLTSTGTTHTFTIPSNVSLLGTAINPNELASADFGDFTCNGTSCTLDATYLTTIGSGATGFGSRWNGANTLAQGKLIDNGTVIGMNATSSTIGFNIQGTAGTNDIFNIASSSTTSVLKVTSAAQVLIAPTARLTIPQGTAPTLSAVGDIAFDTTSNQFQVHDGTAARAIPLFETKSFTIASSTQDAIGTSIPLEAVMATSTIVNIKCFVTGGTSVVMNLTDGTNAMDTITCGTTVTNDDGSIANATIQTNDTLKATIGTETGAWNFLTVTVKRRVDAN